MVQLVTLPDLSTLHVSLQALYVQRAAVCCNGFMTAGVADERRAPCATQCQSPGVCFDATDPTFQAVEWALPNAATSAVIQRLNKSSTICAWNTSSLKVRGVNKLYCDGILYRQCRAGICYSEGSELPTCWNDSNIVKMRREMIAAGLPCDPTEEAWLGCASLPSPG
ncbi:hypothetical protein PINS_up009323 [Pythium insidiosum]|nr:hypothetical protein PINS_up009323 [Pythium insidiosum]